MKINNELTREFLQSHGVQFDGAFWCNPDLNFRLTASNQPNVWLVTIPDLPVGVQQPQPISNYTELLCLMLGCINPYMVKLMEKIKPQGLNQEDTMRSICEAFARLFSFDNNLKFHLNFSPQGFGVQSNNEYTHTLLSGHCSSFKIIYCVNEICGEFEFEIARECVSLDYITKILKENSIKDYEIIEVRELVEVSENEFKYIPFYGAGIKFV